MKPKPKAVIPKQKRIPKEGCLFSGLGKTAFFAKWLGLLTVIAALLGFALILIRAATSYSFVVQSAKQATDEVFFSVLWIYLGTFVGVGVFGGLLLGAGFWLEHSSTMPGPKR